VASAELPEQIRNDMLLHSACVSGASTIDELTFYMEAAGFTDIEISPKDESREFIKDWAPGRNIEDYVISAVITARKAP